MTQIIPSDFDIAAEESAEFVPMRGVANPHLQTMLPRLIRRKVQFNPTGSALTCRTVTLDLARAKIGSGQT